MEDLIPVIAIVTLFIGLPWLVFHYITRWKTAATLSGSDEKLLDELHDAARRLDDRLVTIERIMVNPRSRPSRAISDPGWATTAGRSFPATGIKTNS